MDQRNKTATMTKQEIIKILEELSTETEHGYYELHGVMFDKVAARIMKLSTPPVEERSLWNRARELERECSNPYEGMGMFHGYIKGYREAKQSTPPVECEHLYERIMFADYCIKCGDYKKRTTKPVEVTDDKTCFNQVCDYWDWDNKCDGILCSLRIK